MKVEVVILARIISFTIAYSLQDLERQRTRVSRPQLILCLLLVTWYVVQIHRLDDILQGALKIHHQCATAMLPGLLSSIH